MIRAGLLTLLLATPVAAQEPETEAVLPQGPGRELVFPLCTACHASAVIRRSGLTRDRWDELMDWMTERHGMPALEGEQRQVIVDYLAQHFPPRRATPGGRQRNPFQTE
jgi:hypothetical protein